MSMRQVWLRKSPQRNGYAGGPVLIVDELEAGRAKVELWNLGTARRKITAAKVLEGEGSSNWGALSHAHVLDGDSLALHCSQRATHDFSITSLEESL